METWQIVALGCVGGMLPDVLRIIGNRYDPSTPPYLKSPMFWISFVLLVALGGGVAMLLGAAGPIEALAYGFAAPELVSTLAGAGSAQLEATTKQRLEREVEEGEAGPPLDRRMLQRRTPLERVAPPLDQLWLEQLDKFLLRPTQAPTFNLLKWWPASGPATTSVSLVMSTPV